MMRILAGSTCVVFVAAAAICVSQERAGQVPAFRARSDLVVVDVTVTANGQPQTGLRANDFDLLDDGVGQGVELVTTSSVPLDLSLVVNVSGLTDTNIGKEWKDVSEVAGLLRPTDRVGLMTFGGSVLELVPLSAAPSTLPVAPPRHVEGGSVIMEALLQSLMRPGEPDRRRVVVAVTHAIDAGELTREEQLLEVTERSDAMVDVVLHDAPVEDASLRRFEQFLDVVASTSGGRVVHSKDAIGGFRTILASLDQAYVLAYTPQGVSRTGWHTIAVNVRKPGNLTVRARRGYFAG
jgi:VWFA-related protein